jgi:hypothetical protein
MDYIISESQLRSIVESENTESDKLFKIVSRIIGEGEYSEKYGLYEHDIASVKLRYKVNPKTSLWFETVEYDGVQRKNITGTIYLSIDGIIRRPSTIEYGIGDTEKIDSYHEVPTWFWEDLDFKIYQQLLKQLGPVWDVDFDYIFVDDFTVNENTEPTDEPTTDTDELVTPSWFNMNFDKLKALDKMSVEYLMKTNQFENWFKQSVKQLLTRYSKVNKIVARKDGDMIGYLIWAETTPEMEGIVGLDDPTITIPVIVSTAINPNYRGQGLYNNMFNKSNINGDYLVHASDVLSPYEFWKNKGCETIREVDYQNKVLYCKS